MKTKILSFAMAVLAVAAAAPVSAQPDFPVKRLTSGPAANSTSRMPDHCYGMSCCTTKWVSNPAFGGRGATSTVKKVRACADSCHISAKDRQLTCRKGKSA